MEIQLGMMGRRQLLQSLGLGATSALGLMALPRAATAWATSVEQAVANKAFAVTTVNHLSYPSTDYKKVRDFYADLLGMRVVWDDGTKCQVDCGPASAPNSLYITQAQPNVKPTISHFAFGLPNFWERSAELKAEMLRRKLPGVRADGEGGYFVEGPSGYVSQPVTVMDPAMFPGAATPCEVAKSAKCKDAFEAGHKNLASVPKPSGRGFTAQYFKYIVLHVPDVAKERDYFTSLFGMKVVSDKKDDVSMRFGENTMVLRPSPAGAKPYCNEFGFVVESYDEAKVKAELERRSIASKPNPFGGLAFKDPNGLEIGIGGRT
jgi:catechol 2,3-dioxygenase-like lactoylglutathione lyase family enzyme